MPKCHCKATLKKKPKSKGRNEVYFCPLCGCVYSLVIVSMSNKCANKLIKKREVISIAEVHKKRRKKRREKKK